MLAAAGHTLLWALTTALTALPTLIEKAQKVREGEMLLSPAKGRQSGKAVNPPLHGSYRQIPSINLVKCLPLELDKGQRCCCSKCCIAVWSAS